MGRIASPEWGERGERERGRGVLGRGEGEKREGGGKECWEGEGESDKGERSIGKEREEEGVRV